MQVCFGEYPFVAHKQLPRYIYSQLHNAGAHISWSVRKTRAPAGGMLLSLLAWPLDPQRMGDERREHCVSRGTTISRSL